MVRHLTRRWEAAVALAGKERHFLHRLFSHLLASWSLKFLTSPANFLIALGSVLVLCMVVQILVLSFVLSNVVAICLSPRQDDLSISLNVDAFLSATSSTLFSMKPTACSTWVSSLRSAA